MLPNRKRACFDANVCSAVRCSCFSISSMTPLPPVWMQKCSKACLKSGMYAFIFIFSTCAAEPDVKAAFFVLGIRLRLKLTV